MISQFGIDTYMYPSVRERTTPFNFHERLNPEDAAKARVEILHREMGDELFEQICEADHLSGRNIRKKEMPVLGI